VTVVAAMLLLAAALLAAAGARELRGGVRSAASRERSLPADDWARRAAHRLGLPDRLHRAGMGQGLDPRALLALKLSGALLGCLVGLAAAPAAPGHLAVVVVAGLPAAGFLGPDAWLERRARLRLQGLRGALPDALDLLSVAAEAGRAPLAGLGELASGGGVLGRELAVLQAEVSAGVSQREALANLRERAPVQEIAGMCGVIERSRRFGSPLAAQLAEQATALRAVQRRRVEEQAAKAAPKIQLVVALLLVPSVLLLIAAGLLANVDRFLAGF
jgi:tight adherence protein C